MSVKKHDFKFKTLSKYAPFMAADARVQISNFFRCIELNVQGVHNLYANQRYGYRKPHDTYQTDKGWKVEGETKGVQKDLCW